jgi:hypothetical protein
MVLGSQTGLEFYLKVIPSLTYVVVFLLHAIIYDSNMDVPSSGLRIAPPEAPVTGYMFGKGVYFADMFSKSANYCYPTPTAADGVLLLCEVVSCLIVNFVALLIDLRKEKPRIPPIGL